MMTELSRTFSTEMEEDIIGGYEAEFDPPLSDDFTCCICFLAFRDPMQLNCGHQYCKSCLEKYQGTEESGQFVCPIDREEIDIDKIFPDKAMQRKVLSLLVKCDNEKNSCDWTGELRSLEKHLEFCAFVSIKCTNEGCPVTFLKSELEAHLSCECKFRLVLCGFCKEKYVSKDEEEHLADCKYFPIECTNGCGESNIPRQEMDAHLNNCPLSTLPCDYASLGCAFMGTVTQRHVHERVDMQEHLRIALDRIRFLENETMQTKSMLDIIRNFEKEIESTKFAVEKMNIIETEVAVFKEKNADLERRLGAYERANPKPLKPMEAYTVKSVLTPIERAYKEAEMSKYGTYVWTIHDYQNKLEEAKKSNNRLCSEQFLTSQFGYALRLVVYLNGWGSGKGTHLGLCIQVAKGPNDEQLDWPFNSKISLSILHHSDEAKHKGKTLSPKPKEGEEVNGSFIKPVSGYNSPNGWGDVISHGMILSKGFLCNDTIHVMCKITE